MTSSRPFLFLATLPIKRACSKEKINLTFLRPFDYSVSKYLIFQRISCVHGSFGLFSKIKKGSGASISCTLSEGFFCKNVSYLILYQWSKFQCHTFFLSQDIKQNMLLSSYLDNWWPRKLYYFSWINLWSNGWQGKKRKRKYKNLNTSRTKRAF